jgi:steroid 5-alpha reductase family enzyme
MIIILLSSLFVYFNILFIIAQIKKDNSIVDVFWGIGFIFVAIISLILSQNFGIQNITILVLVLIWGVRLTIHTGMRNKKHGEDPRYTEFRKNWGKYQMLGAYFQVFILQFVVLAILSVAIYNTILNFNAQELSIFAYIGIGVFVVGLFFEAVGDEQLRRFKFKEENSGKILTTGLWKYTRHPNYFGESLIWFGIYLVSIADFSTVLINLVTPLIITLLVRYVSGVPILERRYNQTNKEGWEEYKARTSIFLPLPPKNTQ